MAAKKRRIVVTGGRSYEDWNMVQSILTSMRPDEVYVGCCPTGVDAMVREWCDAYTTKCKVFKANWTKFGKPAGPIRNGEMLQAAGSEALVLAFPGGVGTEDCVRQAVSRNMMVLRVEP